MTLGFKQYFPWHTEKDPAPTYFREKIQLCGTGAEPGKKVLCDFTKGFHKVPQIEIYPKIHTMRSDPHNRWKAGRKIEMVYRGAGYKILDHFNKGIPELEKCVSTQRIIIKDMRHLPIGKRAFGQHDFLITIDNRMLSFAEQQKLARNDGFNSVEDFFRWFNKDWSGKIIHFTDFRY